MEKFQASVTRTKIVERNAKALALVGCDHAIEAGIAFVWFVEFGYFHYNARWGESRLPRKTERVARRVVGHLQQTGVNVVKKLRAS